MTYEHDTQSADSGIYELVGLPKDIGTDIKDSTSDGKRGSGNSVVFIARNRFAVLDKTAQVHISASSKSSR